MFSASSPRAASAYQRINVETSMHTIDQHQLVSLLYAGVLNSIATARGAMASNLDALYDYALRRLIQANARNDDAMLAEVARLIEPLAQSWNEIKKAGVTNAKAANDAAQPVAAEA